MKTLTAQKLRKLTLASTVALAAGWGSLAHAATDTLAVSADVVANCAITTAAMAFGNYDPVVTNASTALDGTGTVTVTCTTGSAAAITLGQGANAATGSTDAAPARRLVNATNYLSYSLFSDTGRAAVWGNDTTVDVATTGTGAADAHTVYGRVAAGQNQPAGAYADTVVATVTF